MLAIACIAASLHHCITKDRFAELGIVAQEDPATAYLENSSSCIGYSA